MITMEVKGITWVGNIYQKFENMCLEAEEMIYEDTIKYLENQVQTVGESVKKFYADVMQDLLPPCDLDERVVSDFPIDEGTNVEVHKKSIMGPKERPSKVDIKHVRKDLRINHVIDKDVTCATSYEKSCDTDVLLTSAPGNSFKANNFHSRARQRVRSTNIRSNLALTRTMDGISSTETETETCRPLSSKILSENHEVPCCPAASISNQSPAEVKMSDLVSDCCSENESSEEIPDLPMFDPKPAEGKEMNVSPSSSGVQSGELNDGWNFDIDVMIEKDPEAMEKGDEQKLEQSCVMVSGDELRLIPMAGDHLKTNKKKMRRVFSLGKKSGRKQEYEQLAVWHGNRGKGKGECVEVSDAASAEENHKKPILPNITEFEWEVL
ncbi:uncharacterized protein LOC129316164 isoform X1 [Prosopis cineraria]|uniref:uncharacterized protein LOC129316164 isoform X1 n=1 Tax=Prosopis cineraria TaxID=364024 RepID=UPI00240F22F9|nr:uncharacterized protein LOC129316164 isoform X1 [Prosopis cineraria]XP_054816435.1 uncharacterized protein LOC129316164 isoform X1 [Prosopis cineraria]XP_054816436.1 uncharacterized protein LOC129316164 isoform X1 [Prosopis cineraria]XP_054816437.1 uncharacterized protein LOC129316164 isoform X1 [Prosopis cineraria]XP_054816438.1 uncharacterized protein LOC129316164 isoform X1 [Prosopis cineraria]